MVPMHPDDMAELVLLTDCASCAHDGVVEPPPPCDTCTNNGGDVDHFERHEWLVALADRLEALADITRALDGKDAVGDSKEALWVQRVVRERHALRAEVEQLRRDLATMGKSDGRVPLSAIDRECRNACICGGGNERGSGCPACEVWHEVRLSTEQAAKQ